MESVSSAPIFPPVQALYVIPDKVPDEKRTNVIVVTPSDPEFEIYRHQTGVFPQNLFNSTNSAPDVIQTPIIKSIMCSQTTQTNTRLCGTVQISEFKEEYCLNCFYCNELFPLAKWSKFIQHLKFKHFRREEAFKKSKFLSKDHDYTPVRSPPINKLAIKHGTDRPINRSLADQIINILNETVLNPNFSPSEEDDIVIIKKSPSSNIDTSSFLTHIMTSESNDKNELKFQRRNLITTSLPLPTSSKNTRPIYTKCGQKDVKFKKPEFKPILPRKKLKRIAKKTLENIRVFEKIYETVKTRYRIDSSKITSPNTTKQTPLSRCLKRSDTITEMSDKETQFSLQNGVQKPIELVFEYTPENIIVCLLDNMELFPVLWEFHEMPFNKEYGKAIARLCRTINERWSLNITPLKMRRSINRILAFYRFMLPCESIDQFRSYYDKCALFLPTRAEEIPRTRCVYCWQCFKRDIDWRRHMMKKHMYLKWPYKCEHCLERFRERDEYEMHKSLPHYKETFKCEECFKPFINRKVYFRHLRYHRQIKKRLITANEETVTEPVYSHECQICHAFFTSAEVLKRHISLKHEKIRSLFKCPICPREYTLKHTLNLHLKRHNNELDFVCEVCGKKFIHLSYLKVHMIKHTGAKVTCNICNIKLTKPSLGRHLRLAHVVSEGTIESLCKPKYNYKNKRIYRPSTKKRVEVLPRRYGCKICKINFDRLKPLKDHNKLFHSDIPKTPCMICNKEFRHLSNVKTHYQEKHKLNHDQIFKLVYLKEDLKSVLAMTKEELENKSEENISIIPCTSDKIQDEIMKAVETIDNQKMCNANVHSMDLFFNSLLKDK